MKFKCEKCGGEIVVEYLKPGEEAQCPHCGAYVKVPQTGAEADEGPDQWGWKKRDWQFVTCPACGGEDLKMVVFWGLHPILARYLRYYIKAIPVRCKKCGNRFDGLTGRSVDEDMATVRNYQLLSVGLSILIGFISAAIIISETIGY
jgi:DNA-directed RNA polymerase subunit RPC12/RpoP